MSTRELIERELDALTEPLQREVYDFAHFPASPSRRGAIQRPALKRICAEQGLEFT